MLSACIILFHGNNKIRHINYESVNSQQMYLYQCYAVKTDINTDSYRVYLFHLIGLIRDSFCFFVLLPSVIWRWGLFYQWVKSGHHNKRVFTFLSFFVCKITFFSTPTQLIELFFVTKKSNPPDLGGIGYYLCNNANVIH